jgi:ATP-binding protein involved in chromosome partitioning
MKPLETDGVQVMSIGFLVDEDQAMIWRGPMATQALEQLLRQTNWNDLDYLLVDMPPGTGDIAAHAVRSACRMTGAVDRHHAAGHRAASTPRRASTMFEKVGVPILGIVENMAVHCCRQSGHAEHIFGADGGKQMAAEYERGLPGLAAAERCQHPRAGRRAAARTAVADPDGEIAAHLQRPWRAPWPCKIAQKARDFKRKPAVAMTKGN